ncbi:MAG: Yop proteins translocation protein K [Puniceicoccales bacterium]|jgi:hypothetical protein|nr:Yop proteins translocation protein K [Puniceicoccales bacterium]
METATYISNLWHSDGPLFSVIYEFNNGMAAYAHSDFFPETVEKKAIQLIAQSPTYGGKILEYVRHLLEIDNLGWYNFSEKRYGLCLLSADEIQRIICYIGGICFSEQIRKIILGRELLKLKHVMGNDAYLFSLRSASLMIRADVAERFQAEGKTLVERVWNTGKSIIEMSLAGLPREIAQRFTLKFPRNFGWNFAHRVDNPGHYFDFVRKVVKRALRGSDNAAVSMIKA